MMDLLPPVGWGDIATKTDLAVLRGEISELRADLRGEIAQVRGEIKSSHAELLRTLFFAMVTSNATLVGLVFAAVKFA